MRKRPRLLSLLLRYAYVFALQSSYTALANAKGTIPGRLARWLLMMHDRLGDELELTHELVAMMLSVRRGVTTALHALRDEGAISAGRRHITVKNRAQLERLANGLYGVPEAEYERLFSL